MRRGQALVLMGLTMLLMVLMVLITLGITTRVREKIELQGLADDAAYTQAIATARTYNSIALLNRAHVSQMASFTATESLISWSGAYRGLANQSVPAWQDVLDQYEDLVRHACPGSRCDCARAARNAVHDRVLPNAEAEKQRVKGLWQGLDGAAGEQARRMQLEVIDQIWAGQKALNEKLVATLRDQKFGGQLAEMASRGAKYPKELSAPKAASTTSVREVDPESEEGASVKEAKKRRHAVEAVMATRGNPFVTGRAGGSGPLGAGLTASLKDPKAVATVVEHGSGYFALGLVHGSPPARDELAWADDHGLLTVQYFADSPCPPFTATRTMEARLRTSSDGSDDHAWTGELAPLDHDADVTVHRSTECTKNCPSVWPAFTDYNPKLLDKKKDLFGQPKNYAVLQRDYNERVGAPPPWQLGFRFVFNPSGAGEQFDIAGLKLHGENAIDISHQTALAAGLAYYHRGGHWQEPPNFFNPFWRATLTSVEIDEQGETDVPAELNNAKVAWAADAYVALHARGFKGAQ